MKKVKTNKLGRRILSIVLTAALVVGLMTNNVFTVRAATTAHDILERVDEYYQIANAGNLMWFAQKVMKDRLLSTQSLQRILI